MTQCSLLVGMQVDRIWNVMAHALKPDFVFWWNGRVHLYRPGSVSSVDQWHSRGVRISGSNAGYIMSWGSVKGTGYPLHSPDSPSLPLPCIVCHHISTRLYQCLWWTYLLHLQDGSVSYPENRSSRFCGNISNCLHAITLQNTQCAMRISNSTSCILMLTIVRNCITFC